VPSPLHQGEGHGSGVRSWNCSREGLPGVWSAERIDGDGGNLGDPPRPGGVRPCPVRGAAGAWRPITGKTGNGSLAGRESEAAVILVIRRTAEPAGREGPLLRSRTIWKDAAGEYR